MPEQDFGPFPTVPRGPIIEPGSSNARTATQNFRATRCRPIPNQAGSNREGDRSRWRAAGFPRSGRLDGPETEEAAQWRASTT